MAREVDVVCPGCHGTWGVPEWMERFRCPRCETVVRVGVERGPGPKYRRHLLFALIFTLATIALVAVAMLIATSG